MGRVDVSTASASTGATIFLMLRRNVLLLLHDILIGLSFDLDIFLVFIPKEN